MRQAVETYLRDMNGIRATGAGTKETSFYPPLINLLNTIGHSLKPPLRAISTVRNTGAGIPDVGLFTADQRSALESDQPFQILPPARGVMEVKGLAEDVEKIAASEQVLKYANQYNQVLVTNFRDFLLVDRDSHGELRSSERITLSMDERSFWRAAQQPKEFAGRIGDQLVEYLHRVMVRQVSLTQPRDVALLLSSYARDMRTRLEHQRLDDLAPMREALEDALGIAFEGKEGAHFFRSTIVQTLFYGMFSAWVLQNRGIARRASDADFDWKTAGYNLKVPAIQTLFHEFVRPDSVDRLGLKDLLDWTSEMLNRIDAVQFFARFSEVHAVQYFYEPFLEAFDPELRKQLGVWYTPHEIVTYMVERVDTVLREELGVARGLADPNVYVLDPCTGTGSYLVGVLRRIHKTLREEGADALTASDLKEAVKTRLFGFELMPAPFVVAHLQLGLALQDLGAPLQAGSNERPAIYLTNALTGWDVVSNERYTQTQAHSLLASLERERNAAGEVKRDKPILVVIGNPPYNGYAGIGVDEERDLSNAYRKAKQTKQPQGQGLNDLYVRFFRMAERRIVEQTGKGVVCYISNYSWLDGLSFTAMRERYLDVFDRIWIDNLNGDKYKTGKTTPDGAPDPSIFSTEWNREGIQVGTAISLLVRKEQHSSPATVQYRSLWGTTKHQQLLDSVTSTSGEGYHRVESSSALGFPMVPIQQNEAYLSWPLLPDLFPVSFPGVKTSRDDVLVDIDRDRLIERMETYFDPERSDAEIEQLIPGIMESSKQFNPTLVRSQLVKRGFLPHNIIRYAYRPFDARWLYWERETNLLDRNREEYLPHVGEGNMAIISQQKPRRKATQSQVISSIGCLHLTERGANCIPLFLKSQRGDRAETKPNCSEGAQNYIANLNASEADLYFHAIAATHSPIYVIENDGALQQDWPRIPLPNDEDNLAASAELGRELADLLDIEQDVPGVGSGMIRPELRSIAVLSRVDGGTIDPGSDDLALTASWGRGGNGKPVMPGRGRVVARDARAEETDCLGALTRDVYLNENVYWRNVPERVWDYSLGGYQVLKKWLSYREDSVLGRRLKPDEVRTFTQIARRIAAILMLEEELDASYLACSAETWDWPAAVAAANPQRPLFPGLI